jgi:hypothetical protein
MYPSSGQVPISQASPSAQIEDEKKERKMKIMSVRRGNRMEKETIKYFLYYNRYGRKQQKKYINNTK